MSSVGSLPILNASYVMFIDLLLPIYAGFDLLIEVRTNG